MCHNQGAIKTICNYFKSILITTGALAILIAAGCNESQLPGLGESLEETPSPVQVIETHPPDNAQNVELNHQIQASFNTAIDSATINESTFIIREDTSTIAGSFSYSDSIVTFIPSKEFNRNKVINTTISSEIADTQGNSMAQDYEWSFATRPPTTEELTPPSVADTDPKHRAKDISISTNISARFSKALNPETINSNTFYLQSNSSIVSGSVSYTDSTATFNPSGMLRNGTEYTATITSTIQDLFGNTLTDNYQWRFTTKERDRTSPRVLSTNPRDDDRNVEVDTEITATFNEAMDPATINDETFLLYERRRSGFRQISGSVSYSGNTARFTPNRNLRDKKDYVAAISASVTDLAGNSLTERYRWNFETEDD